MTAILGIFGSDERPTDETLATRMLEGMRSRGGARASVWREGGVVIAISRHEWEFGPGFSSPVLVVQDGDHVIAADASIYYRDDLRRKLVAKGVRPKGQTPSHLILAAYQAFGTKCPEIVEGDFSFVIWDRKARRAIAARDFAGSRPLFFADLNGTLIIASSIAAILQHPDCHAGLDVDALGLDVAGCAFSVPVATCYRGIQRLDGASCLVADRGRTPQVRTFWSPVVRESSSAPSFADAAAQLRELIANAVTERLDPEATTAIWLSGGWDSTAVFAAGQWKLARTGEGNRLQPVSRSHPVGDPGREDEKIVETAALWKSPVTWGLAADTPLVEPLVSRSQSRDEPIEHLFTGLNRALSEGSRAIGARVAFDGYGGDFLFSNSRVFLADLLATGRLVRLAREWSVLWKHGRRRDEFFRSAVQPLLSPRALSLLATLRRRQRFATPFECSLPHWIDGRFAEQHQLRDRSHMDGAPPRVGHYANAEVQWKLTQRYFTRTRAWTCDVALETGVEVRAPLYDRRVIEFSIARPASERNSMGEHKRLLRQAMAGLLPGSVLGPRPFRTGALNDYFRTAFASAESIIRAEIARPLVLSELGIVDASSFRTSFDRFFRRGCTGPNRLELVNTLLAELWLRAQNDKERKGFTGVPSIVKPHQQTEATQFSYGDSSRTCVGQELIPTSLS
jgi:asparagine synthase (glutamine-hydrolysing)